MKKTTTYTLTIISIAFSLALTGCATDSEVSNENFTNSAELGTIEGSLASTCSLEIVGGDATCMATADWKNQVAAVCGDAGGSIGTVGYADSCGEGQWRRAKFQCCGMQTEPTTQSTCDSAVTGSQDVCLSIMDWKNALQNKCATAGTDLTNISFQDQCDGGYRFASYTCCEGTAEITNTPTEPVETLAPAAPNTCQMHLLGNGNTCQTAAHWNEQAGDTCALTGQAVEAVTLGADCGGDTYTFASATCCAAAPEIETVTETAPTPEVAAPIAAIDANAIPHFKQPVLPEPEQVCGTHYFGNGTKCVDHGTWRTLAREYCGTSGARATEMALDGECKGGSTHARITCCQEVAQCAITRTIDATCVSQDLAKQAAAASCKRAGGELTSIDFGDKCGKGRAAGFRFSCCPAN